MKIPNLLKYPKKIARLSSKPLIVSAGMPRSGSTLLFNVVREILLVKWKNRLSSGWEGDVAELPKGDAFLLKTHTISMYYRLRASYIFYSYRDVRVAAVSRSRKFNTPITLAQIGSEIREYERAKSASDFLVKYENFINEPDEVIRQLANILGICIEPTVIREKCFSLASPEADNTKRFYSRETLLHKDHFTYTQDDEWRKVIPADLQRKINREYSWWFNECGYVLD